ADAQDRLYRAQADEVDRHVPSGRDRHAHRNRRAIGSPGGAPGIGRLGSEVPIQGSAPAYDDGKDQGGQSVAPTPPSTEYRAPHWGTCNTTDSFMPDKFSINSAQPNPPLVRPCCR